ncbi:MAG: CHAD domain-containing protein [Acidobacteriota bacterium]
MARKRAKTDAGAPIGQHAREQASALLRRFAFQMNRTARQADADAIHDIRVAIRRFSQCLRVFRQFFPKGRAKKVRAEMKSVLDLAAEVRNRDIALELLKEAGIEDGSRLGRGFARERRQTEEALRAAIRRLARQNFSRKWRAQLQV